MVKGNAQPGIYSATYSGIPVYEFQFGDDLKEHVMRRRQDDWINATHILKAAGFDKPARTRILEREVQKDKHEKIQGGYGKYQGTWIPLEKGEELARRNNVYDRLQPIFEFQPGAQSPPPAPRHASKPKAPKRPAVPKWPVAPAPPPPPEEFELGDSLMNDDDTPDNLTIASASYMAEDDRLDLSHHSTGHRKRKREEALQDITQQQHAVYGDELLDYFLLSRNDKPAHRPEPPPNFQPNLAIDSEENTALHWAAAMGDIEVIRQLKRFGAALNVQNIRGETPFMRAVNFTNCYDKETFSLVIRELIETVHQRDKNGFTVMHHAVAMKSGRPTSHSCARYYIDIILNRLQESVDPQVIQHLVDAQDDQGNTALHLAAERNARKCIRALLGRNASVDILNHDGVSAEDLIRQLNEAKKEHRASGGAGAGIGAVGVAHHSSSPFAPDSHRRHSFRNALGADGAGSGQGTGALAKFTQSFDSEAASAVQLRIAPLIMEKFNDLSASYEEELREKKDAEKDAHRLLAGAQADLNMLHLQIAECQDQLEPDEVAASVANEANLAKHEVMSLITNQNRLQVQQAIDGELAALNGSGADETTSYAEQLSLAQQLQSLLNEQRQAETDYVDALSMVGTGENIEKYRRLLKRCLDPKDAENLDSNLDSLIEMMEEERDVRADVDAMDMDGAVGIGLNV